jgi:hypothetical protein
MEEALDSLRVCDERKAVRDGLDRVVAARRRREQRQELGRERMRERIELGGVVMRNGDTARISIDHVALVDDLGKPPF